MVFHTENVVSGLELSNIKLENMDQNMMMIMMFWWGWKKHQSVRVCQPWPCASIYLLKKDDLLLARSILPLLLLLQFNMIIKAKA